MDLPDTYIGSIVKERSDQYIVDNVKFENEDGEEVEREMIVKKKIDYVPGIYKIFDEKRSFLKDYLFKGYFSI